MIIREISCFIALTLVTLVHGDKHDELLAAGYQYFAGVGYYYFNTTRNYWKDAQKDCMSSNGRLAVVNSEDELKAILTVTSTNTFRYVFMGFTNQYETQFVTTEGIPLNHTGYTKWETGYPTGNMDYCGSIHPTTGEYKDLNCSLETTFYICEHQLWFDYSYFQGIGWYMLHVDGLGWADAYDTCESEGAHLLVIDSQAEAEAVMQLLNQHPHLPNTDSDDSVFIGFRAVMNDLSTDPYSGTYLTVLGTSVSDVGYVKWSGNEPQVGSNKFCGTLNRSDASYVMKPCNSHFAFFCEKDLEDFKR